MRHDPIFTIDEDAETLRLAVTQCRGLSPAGCIVDIDPEHPLHCKVVKTELEGVVESPVYIVADPHAKETLDGEVDQFNPQMKTERRSGYRLALQVTADEIPYSVVVARVKLDRLGVRGMRVTIRGAGIRTSARTGAGGVARIVVRPTRTGIATVHVAGQPARCGVRRIGVVGIFRPPSLTG